MSLSTAPSSLEHNTPRTLAVASVPRQTNSTFPYQIGTVFEDPLQLEKDARELGRTHGFTVAKSFRYFSKEDSQKPAGAAERGHLYCNSIGNGQRNKSECPWQIRFGYRSNKRQYVITACCLQHQKHSVAVVEHNGRVFVESKSEMQDSEVAFVRKVGQWRLSFREAEDIIRKEFPTRSFNKELLRRELRTSREHFYGKDAHRIDSLFALARTIQQEGGTFDVDANEFTHRIETVTVQSASMIPYAETYDDFVVIDGTHGLNKYKLIAIILVVVDALGFSMPAGFSLNQSENNEVVKTTLEKSRLASPGKTLMSDGAQAFASIAEQLRMLHILCAYHYQQTSMEVKGLSGGDRNLFMSVVNSFIYNDFVSHEALEVSFQQNRVRFASTPAAVKYLDNLWSNRCKVCRYYTKDVFTCGHNSSVRSESTNSQIKGGGEWKRLLRNATLIESVSQITSQIEANEEKALREIMSLVSQRKAWSTYVDKIWRANQALTSEVSYQKKVNRYEREGATVLLFRNMKTGLEHLVTVFDSKEYHPICQCHIFKSTKIPCEGICSTFPDHVGHCQIKNLFCVENLPYRWRVESHPLYAKALHCLGVVPPSSETTAIVGVIGNTTAPAVDQNFMGVSLKDYNRVKVPKGPKARFTRLHSLLKNELLPKVTNNERLYKWAEIQIRKLINQSERMIDQTVASSTEIDCVEDATLPSVLPPLTRVAGRILNDELTNAANRNGSLAKNKKRKAKGNPL